MVSILDIAPPEAKHTTVPLRGADVDFHGLTLGNIAFLVKQFPEVRDMFSGKDVSVSIDDLIDRAPMLVHHIIACGLSVEDDAKGLAVVMTLTVEEQVTLLDAIMRETFKGGIGPFVETVKRLFGVASDVGSKVRGSNSPKPPRS